MRTLRSLSLAVASVAGITLPVMGTAHADPAGFPDLNGLPTDDWSSYSVRVSSFYAVSLYTPDKGIGCWTRSFYDPAKYDEFQCSGNIPGVGDETSSDEEQERPCATLNAGGGDGEIQQKRYESTCKPDPFPGVVFPSGRKITKGPVTCGSTGDVLIACINSESEHGFVISRARTWTF